MSANQYNVDGKLVLAFECARWAMINSVSCVCGDDDDLRAKKFHISLMILEGALCKLAMSPAQYQEERFIRDVMDFMVGCIF